MLYIKLLHILSVFFWFGGLLSLGYLFTVMVYENSTKLNNLASKIYQKVVIPAGMSATTLGIALAAIVYKFQGGWIHAKITLVIILFIYQIYAKKIMKNFAIDKNQKSATWLQNFNFIGWLIFAVITFFAVIRPF